MKPEMTIQPFGSSGRQGQPLLPGRADILLIPASAESCRRIRTRSYLLSSLLGSSIHGTPRAFRKARISAAAEKRNGRKIQIRRSKSTASAMPVETCSRSHPTHGESFALVVECMPRDDEIGLDFRRLASKP